ncbi:MAG: hypothetical protein ACFFHD_09005 [Promethearchaeota archaeon]
MSGIFDLVKRYPWLNSLEKLYSDIALKDPIDFINDIFISENNYLYDRVLEFFKGAFEKIEQFSYYKDDEINIYLYLVLKILLFILDNNHISNRIAELYSKITYSELNKENDSNLYNIYQDLNLEVIYEQEPTIYKKRVLKDQIEVLQTNFKINFIDYLKLSSHLKDEYRKLVNNALSKGYVYIKPTQINRLIQEYVRNKILNKINVDSENLNKFKESLFQNQKIKDLYDKISAEWEKKKETFDYSTEIEFKEGEDLSEIFPPCVKEILSKAHEGQNLIHTERLYILWFLNALNYPEEKIINVFSTLPDFDKEKTRYQVRYAMKKGYTPYSCQSLKSMNLCMANQYNDELCKDGYYSKELNERKKLAHPLSYTRIKQYRASRLKNHKEEKLQKENE